MRCFYLIVFAVLSVDMLLSCSRRGWKKGAVLHEGNLSVLVKDWKLEVVVVGRTKG